MPSIPKMPGPRPSTASPRPADESPKIYLLLAHRYRHDETWHPVAAFGSHAELMRWLETRSEEFPHGYAIENVPCLGGLAGRVGSWQEVEGRGSKVEGQQGARKHLQSNI